MLHRRTLLAAAAAGAATTPLPAFAQEFPNRPVRLLLSFPAGGSTDGIMRLLAENAGKALGQTVVVEPKPGAGGTLPAALMQSSPADGYTIAQISSGVFRLSHMTKTTWDPIQDLKYIIGLSGYVFGVVVSASGPIHNWSEFVAYAKANPGKLTFGSVGVMSTPYLTMESVAKRAGIQLLHVPYKGSAELNQALLADQIMAVADSTSFAPHVQAGKMRFISVWSDRRLSKFPDTPTLREQGLDFVQTSPIGLAAPRDTPPAVVKRLHDAFKTASEQPNFLEALNRYDMLPGYMDSAQFTRYAQETVNTEKALMDGLGIKRAV